MGDLTRQLPRFEPDSDPLNGNWTDAAYPSDVKGSSPTGRISLYLLVPAWSRIAVLSFAAIMFVIGVPGNTGLIIVLIRKKLKGSTDIYLTWLAVGDIVSLTSTCLFNIVKCLPDVWKHMGSDWLCRFHFYIQHWGVIISTVLVFGIGVDRYFKVLRPHYTGLYRAAKIVCATAYVTIAIFAMVFAVTSHEHVIGGCRFNPSYKLTVTCLYAIVNIAAAVFSVILLGVYIRIAAFLKKREQEKLRIQRHALGVSFIRPGLPNRELAAGDSILIHVVPNPDSDTGPRSGQVVGSRDSPRRAAPDDDHRMQQLKITTMSMMLITIVFFISTVLPTLAMTILSSDLIKNKSDATNVVLFFAIRLPLIGNVANPFLLLISGSEFRTLVSKLFQSTCARRTSAVYPSTEANA